MILTLLFLAVFLSITLILFFADLMFAIIFYPTFLNFSIPIVLGQDKFATYILYDYR